MSFAEQFAAEGWLRIGGLFDPALIDEVREECERQLESLTEIRDGHRAYLNVGDKRLMLPVRLTGALANPKLYANPLLLTMLRPLLGEDFLIDNFACVVALPGALEQHAHEDHPDLFPEMAALRSQLPPYAVTVAIPLVDLTEETGTTRIVAGSNREGSEHSEVLPYLNRGDCFLMDYRTEHNGTPNRSPAARAVLFIIYARYWFIDIRNFRRQPRINIGRTELGEVPAEHRFLFRRLAAKGSYDASQKELFPGMEDLRERRPVSQGQPSEPPRD
jgi:hypothetical protein